MAITSKKTRRHEKQINTHTQDVLLQRNRPAKNSNPRQPAQETVAAWLCRVLMDGDGITDTKNRTTTIIINKEIK